jgi:hypothetical protein
MAIPVPPALFSATDQQAQQLRELANEEGYQLSQAHAWQALIREKIYTTIAQEEQTAAVPADFSYYLNDSMFNRSQNRKVIGPLNQFEWQQQKSGPTYLTVELAFRFRNNQLLITPTPVAGETLAFEYITLNWCESAGGTEQQYFIADDDVALLDEDLMSLGVEWRFLKAKGFDYSEAFRKYQIELQRRMSRDGGAPSLSLSQGMYDRVTVWPFNIPDGNWP